MPLLAVSNMLLPVQNVVLPPAVMLAVGDVVMVIVIVLDVVLPQVFVTIQV